MNRIKIVSCTAILAAMAVCVAQEQPQGASNANKLTESQKQAVDKARQAVDSETKIKAVAMTLKLAAIAKELDRSMLADQPDPDLDRKLQNDLTQAVTEMVAGVLQTKINADREMVKILTPEQKKLLRAEVEKIGSNPDLAELIGELFLDKK